MVTRVIALQHYFNSRNIWACRSVLQLQNLFAFLVHPIQYKRGFGAEMSFHWVCDCAKIFSSNQPSRGQVEIVDKRLKSMMKELGDAINNSLSDSDEIADVISRIKDGGYDVFVVLEATIGFNSQSEDETAGEALSATSSADFEMTTQDLKFLKSLRISVGEERLDGHGRAGFADSNRQQQRVLRFDFSGVACSVQL